MTRARHRVLAGLIGGALVATAAAVASADITSDEVPPPPPLPPAQQPASAPSAATATDFSQDSADQADPVQDSPDAVEPISTPEPAVEDTTLADGRAPVEVHLTFTESGPDHVVAAGYAAVVETGGSCTLELSREGQRFVIEQSAEVDATTTPCGALVMAVESLEPGEWEAVLRYESATSYGVSAQTLVAVR